MNDKLLDYVIVRYKRLAIEEARLWRLVQDKSGQPGRAFDMLHAHWLRALERRSCAMDQLITRGGIAKLVQVTTEDPELKDLG